MKFTYRQGPRNSFPRTAQYTLNCFERQSTNKLLKTDLTHQNHNCFCALSKPNKKQKISSSAGVKIFFSNISGKTLNSKNKQLFITAVL